MAENISLLSGMELTTVEKQVAAYLLEIGAIRINPAQPFTWSSGWNSPIYCDNRVALSYPHIRSFIKTELASAVKRAFPAAGCVAGVATAGIAQGALVADVLNLPFAYVRPEPKKHGMGNQIEGRIAPGSQVVLVEDLISTGGSSLKAVEALRQHGAEVIGLVAIFTYGFPVAEQNFAAAGVPFKTLSSYEHLLELASEEGKITTEQLQNLQEWRKSPDTWGKSN